MAVLRNVLVLGALVLLLSGIGAARTTYDIAVDAEEDTSVLETTIQLTADGANYWDVSWTPPENSEILSINDTIGEITDYETIDGTLRFETNRHNTKQDVEVVTIRSRMDGIVAEQYGNLSLIKIRLSGYSGEQTDVSVRTEQDLLSESHSFGYAYGLGPHQANFSGTGAINVHLAVSDAGEQYEHFRVFGDGNLSAAEDAYYLIQAVTGTNRQVNAWPVIVLPDEEYSETVDQWSAGQYRTGGLIFLREKTLEADDGTAVVLHEVMHGFNELPLKWARAGGEWFDEGMAKYIEHLYRYQRNIRQAELFGEPVEWTAQCENGRGQCKYTLPPRSTPDTLWHYYESDEDFMHSWSPHTSADADTRRFGYAYGELVIRDFVRRNGQPALREVYAALGDIETQTDTANIATERILDTADIDFTPCYPNERDSFDECLNDINERAPQVPKTIRVNDETRSITIDPIERPERKTGTVERVTEQLGDTFSGGNQSTQQYRGTDTQSDQRGTIGRIIYVIGQFLVELANIFK